MDLLPSSRRGDDDLPFLPMELWASTHISKWEEIMIGVPDDKTNEWRIFQQVPDSNVVDQIRKVMAFSDGDEETVMVEERESQKRGLSTVSTQSRQGSDEC
jgi:hypothetical protein